MERSRSTHKRGRRHDALRRTLRRQGVFQQEGGARAADWTLFPAGTEAVKAFLTTALANTDFAFLTAEGIDAAKKYAMLIMRQDELLTLGLTKVRTALGITNETTDTELVDSVSKLDDPTMKTYITALQQLAEAIIQDQPIDGGKIAYNLYNSIVQSPRQQLINILLYPTLMTNVLVNGIADVLKLLKHDKSTYDMITAENVTQRTIYHKVLADKYTWYILSYAASATNDTLKDSFCLWETNTMGSELRWKAFFTDVFNHLVTGDTLTFGSLQKELQRIYKTQESYVKDMGNNRTPDTIICSLLSAIVFRKYNSGEDMKGCIAPFVDIPVGKGELKDMPITGLASSLLRPYKQSAPSINLLTGMLADTTKWDQPLFDGDDELSKKITFTNLLNNLNPRHIHFLLHLVYVLFKPEEVASTAGGAAASSSPLPVTEQSNSQGSPSS